MNGDHLTRADMASLQKVAEGQVIPPKHREKLLRLGLIDTPFGGDKVSPKGQQLLSRNPNAL